MGVLVKKVKVRLISKSLTAMIFYYMQQDHKNGSNNML